MSISRTKNVRIYLFFLTTYKLFSFLKNVSQYSLFIFGDLVLLFISMECVKLSQM